jgi:hypothetical protein
VLWNFCFLVIFVFNINATCLSADPVSPVDDMSEFTVCRELGCELAMLTLLIYHRNQPLRVCGICVVIGKYQTPIGGSDRLYTPLSATGLENSVRYLQKGKSQEDKWFRSYE